MYLRYFFVLISAALVYGKTTYVSVPQERLPELLRISMECIAKTGVGADTLGKLVAMNFQDSEPMRKYMFCFGHEAGLTDDSGHIVKESVMKLIGNYKRKDELSRVIDECNKLSNGDKYENVFKNTVCFQEKSPILFKL